MGLQYEDLNDVTRLYMIEEIKLDASNEKIYLSPYLTQRGQGDFLGNLLEAARCGTDDTLAASLRGYLNMTTPRRQSNGRTTQVRVPYNAAEVLAESEFNRFYVRGLSRRAIEEGIPRLQVYRAKAVAQPRPESQRLIGLLCDPEVLLTDVRSSVGVETALGVPPGPGSGITVRIPKS